MILTKELVNSLRASQTTEHFKPYVDITSIDSDAFADCAFKVLDLFFTRFAEIPPAVFPTSLIQLNLFGNDILRAIPSFQGLVNLQILNIINVKRLETISSFEGLPNLETLNLNANKNLETIPSLKDLCNLLELRIINNERLGEIPSLQGLGKLQRLSLFANPQLTEIPSFEELGELQELKLFGNTRLHRIPSLQRLGKLQKLSICLNQERSELFEGLNSLTTLNMEYGKYYTEDLVISIVDKLPNLTNLRLCKGNAESKGKLFDKIMSRNSITEFDGWFAHRFIMRIRKQRNKQTEQMEALRSVIPSNLLFPVVSYMFTPSPEMARSMLELRSEKKNLKQEEIKPNKKIKISQ